MRHRALGFAVLLVLILSALPALAQQRTSGFRMHSPRGAGGHHAANPSHLGTSRVQFIPGIGLWPVQRFSPGFDATHNSLIRGGAFNPGFFPGHHRGFHGGFVGGRFNNPNFSFGFGGFFPYYPAVSSGSTVVVVQQPVEVPVPVVIDNEYFGRGEDEVVVAAGLPDDWPRLRVAASSYAPQQQPLPAIILLVRENEVIIPAVDYWTEDNLVFYVTSTGRQGSFPLRELDWNMTTRLNSERGYEFNLRTAR
jgi:hypothetical protein